MKKTTAIIILLVTIFIRGFIILSCKIHFFVINYMSNVKKI